LRAIADKHDLILIFDEIQVGLGRTGKTFCFQHEGVIPDGLILGKAISGGLVPLSVFVTHRKIMDLVFSPGSDGSTYGGYPLAAVAGIAALEVLETEKLARRSESQGVKLMARLRDLSERSPHIKEVRGRGLFIGIEVAHGDAMKFCRALLDHGILANDSHGHTIRISPPLIIEDHELDHLCKGLEKVLI
jgi:ornithine--oxo-acid transaminase